MSRRTRSLVVKCLETGCRETAIYDYSNREEYRHVADIGRTYRCLRHKYPHEVITREHSRIETVLTLSKIDGSPGLYWLPKRSGFVSGPGFQLNAEDFTEGTQVRVTVEVLAPQAAQE